ncbi:MAG: shikimate kinase [Rhodospirillaceae bacterium]|jgi:shikimate kinase|nr:shikimate kinase [Rhodospirillaceae bacterium]MBT4487131.1 shikimate kinase [Rhodospirillaceae bacterium]MBT5193962.1 shikimate kinase [Rhodospirillaceae bacterium]MBT5897831.1 shikimate kinase [Rhodospirillaceae bacterium]MBT6431160.1 shikimate kinase [Rhodospirillaceae bacterium]
MIETDIPDVARGIVLVGLMGAGKSSVGRRLAKRLGLMFFDADQEIEKAADCTIDEIFSRHGEAEFRAGERRVIARLLAGPPHVLATGGGAFMDPETRAAIREQGISIWLRADLDVLLERVLRRDNRPLLKQGDPKEILRKLMVERDPVYAQADMTVTSGQGPHEDVVEQIVSALRDITANGAKDTS